MKTSLFEICMFELKRIVLISDTGYSKKFVQRLMNFKIYIII